MKFEKVRKGEYRAQVRGRTYVWVLRQGRQWFWCLGGYATNEGVWETDNNGPFATRREAIADAIANYLGVGE